MKKMMKDMLRKLKEQKGATAVEYALMVTLIALAILTAVTNVGTAITSRFTAVVTAL